LTAHVKGGRIGVCVVAAFVGLVVGCAKVDSRPDFKRAAGMVADRTGVAQPYDPAEAELVESRVDALLRDGLTTDEAVCVALLNNRGFQALFETIGASRADVVQSGLLTNPSLSANLQFPDAGGRPDYKIGFGQEIVDLWQIPVRKKIAQSQLEQTILAVVRQGVTIAADVKSKCYQLLAFEQAETITREDLKLVQRTLDVAQKRFHAGEVGQLDVNLARASVLNVQLALISIARDRGVAEAALERTLGLGRSARKWTLRDSLPTTVSGAASDDTLMATAVDQRLDARAAEMATRAAQDDLRREYLSVFPSIVLGAELERLEGRSLAGRKVLADTARESIAAGKLTAPTIQSRAERARDRRADIATIFGPTVTMTLPIWDQNQAKIAKARHTLVQKQKEYEDLMDVVAQEVRQAATAVRASRELIGFYREQGLPQAEANVEMTRKAYEAGEQGIVTMIEAQEALITERRAYLNVLRDGAIAVAELEAAVGGRLPAAATTQPASTQPAGS
jgi:cobalt-zinc-cadmium efflux system outer membrane protein